MTQSQTPVRVLVVDDDPMSRDLLCILLQGEGYAAESADSGESALAVAGAEGPPDVVLTDLQMPGISGERLAKELRRVCGPATILMAMSGSQPEEQTILGFDGFLLKPFELEQLAAAVEVHRRVSSKSETASNKGMGSYLQETESIQFTTAASDGGPVLNETIYQQLARTMPAPQLHEMYTMCVDDARERIAQMRRLVASQDAALFVREAHAIKGSSGMLGATQLHGMAAELERNGLDTAESSTSQEVNSLDELSAACDRLERMLGARV